jgi:hypothetical protein
MELERQAFGPVQASLNVGASVVYFGHGVIRHEDLVRRRPLVASIALTALAAQQAAQP